MQEDYYFVTTHYVKIELIAKKTWKLCMDHVKTFSQRALELYQNVYRIWRVVFTVNSS